MEAARVLCLDLNSRSGSARMLGDILESCPNRPIHVGHELISPATDAFSVGEIHQRISRFQPSMLVVLLSSDSAKQATTLVEEIPNESAVTQCGNTDQVQGAWEQRPAKPPAPARPRVMSTHT